MARVDVTLTGRQDVTTTPAVVAAASAVPLVTVDADDTPPAFWSDTFDYNGTPEAGWSVVSGTWESVGDPWNVMDNSSGDGLMVRDTNTGDHKITSNVRIGSSSFSQHVFGVVARCADANNLIGWEVVLDSGGDKTVLYMIIDDVETTLTEVPGAWDFGNEPELALMCHERGIVAYIDGEIAASWVLTAAEHAALDGTNVGLIQFNGRSSWLDATAEASAIVEATSANTGPRVGSFTALTAATALANPGTYRERQITGNFDIGYDLGTDSWTFIDCTFDNNIFVRSPSQIVLDHCEAPVLWQQAKSPADGADVLAMFCNFPNGTGFQQLTSGLSLDWSSPGRDVPARWLGNYIDQPWSPVGDHTSCMTGEGWGIGHYFLGCTWVHQGPQPSGATATMNFHGDGSEFVDCVMRFRDGVAAYYTVYIEGPDITVTRARMQSGAGGYANPDQDPLATYIDCTDYSSGDPIDPPNE